MTSLTPDQILRTLAALAPGAQSGAEKIAAADRVAVPLSYTSMFESRSGHAVDPGTGQAMGLDPDVVGSVLARARLSPQSNPLRLGWLWLAAVDDDGTQIVTPLVSMPVRTEYLQPLSGLLRRVVLSKPNYIDIVGTGLPELSEMITEPAARRELESTVAYGGGALASESGVIVDPALLSRLPKLQTWAKLAAGAAGFSIKAVTPTVDADRRAESSQTTPARVSAQVMLYVGTPNVRPTSVAATLAGWDRTGTEFSALAAAFGIRHQPPVDPADQETSLDSPIVLSPRQREAVRRARLEPIVAISGPPGSGKTQTIAAIALDAVGRGESVLIAAPSESAVEALIDLMERVPGPDPVVFAGADSRRQIADQLGQGGGRLLDEGGVEAATERVRQAHAAVSTARSTLDAMLTSEQLVAGDDSDRLREARAIAPRWFEPGFDVNVASDTLARAERVGGLFADFRRKRVLVRLARNAGATSQSLVAPTTWRSTIDCAIAYQNSLSIDAAGGLDLTQDWQHLFDAERVRRERHADWLDAVARDARRVDDDERATMAIVAAALRSGRTTRRDKLGEIAGRRLASAIPLWIGSLREVDDLLPHSTMMFDVVIVDEASQVDLISAAPALLRGRRAVVVGDPKQLRHVSFLADSAVATALADAGVTDHTDAARLDVRRLSLFDLAASSTPTSMLDEHFRSAPHLIGFSMRRFYDGDIAVATTHPRNDTLDCIDVVRVGGRRDEAGVNAAEIDAVLELVRRQLSSSSTNHMRVGVVTPFRAQADAVADRLVTGFTLEQLDLIDLKSGTVHGFQGCERDLVIISLTIDDRTAPSAASFLNDPNLFNVMVTRARSRVVVVTSLVKATGLADEYLRYGEAGPQVPSERGRRSPLVDTLATDLLGAGVAVRANYPAGRHTLELVVGDHERALGVTCGIHPDGVAAHIERRMALQEAGWEIREVFQSRWHDRTAELAVDLTLEARRRTSE